MPFSNLNSNWSNLAQYYNNPASFKQTSKPSQPSLKYVGFDDGLIRGGIVNTGISVIRDVARVGKFFLSGKGLLFSAKQFGLQMSNPRLESKIDTGDVSGIVPYKPIGPTRIFNAGINELASVAGNAFGLHFDRAGLFPIIPDDQKYEAVVKYNNFNAAGVKNMTSTKDSTNRLVRYAYLINNAPFTRKLELDKYQGGAQSVYGLYPKTTITTADIRTTTADITDGDSSTFPPKQTTIRIPGSKTIASATPTSDLKLRNSNLEAQLSSSISPHNKDIASKNIEKRLGVSNKNNVDAINVINVTDSKTFYSNSSSALKLASAALNRTDVDGYYGRDIIKFRLEFLNNDNPVSGGSINTDVLAFRAYINEFSDGMNAKWDSYRYMGRGEEFYVYNGFTRDISVGFTIFAHSPKEMAPLYNKLNYLMSTFAPDYSPNLKMRGNIGYLTIGDYIYRQPGIFTDIKLSNMLDTSWEIAMNDDKDQYEIPKHINVGMSFKPIHTFLPRRVQAGKYNNTPFITPDKNAYPEAGVTNKYLT